ncbi:MAG TPA: GNAT family N-acetyltransferase [Stellaceae bacterium]|nr:GNAT family N-acetyltransferase [Stellaceae bacterium]
MSEMRAPKTAVERLVAFTGTDLEDLCDAAEDAIKAGGGFGWVVAPPRHIMEAYWRGVLLVPERRIFVARLDNTICGSAQLARPPRNNEAQSFAAQLTSNFIAPWARGHGLAKRIVLAVEEAARAAGFDILNLDVRATQEAAIQLYESLGYQRWGVHPAYARVAGVTLPGYFYYKRLTGEDASPQ